MPNSLSTNEFSTTRAPKRVAPPIKCVLCGRTVTQPHEIKGLGKLGSDCYSQIAGLEPLFERLAEVNTPGPCRKREPLRDFLKGMGFKAKLAVSGSDGNNSLYRVEIVGKMPKFETFKGIQQAYLKQLQGVTA